MIPVNSVLQVGQFPEVMQMAIDQRITPVRFPDINASIPPGSYESILIRSNTQLPIQLLEKLPSVKMVATCGVGYDNLPLDYLQEKGIKASNTPGVLNDAVCELAIGMLFGLLRRIPQAHEFVNSKAWSKGLFTVTTTLAGKQVGIAGMGRIGQDLAKRLEHFKVKIAYTGPSRKKLPYEYFPDIKSLAKASDVLFLACPATPETEKMVGTEVLEALGPQGHLINIARGSVVDEAALLVALQQNRIAGAALDVFENEPNPNPGFLNIDNVLLTPHIGSATSETRQLMTNLAIDNLEAFYNKRPLLTEVQN
ncbi:MAG: hydroxyacid dehydrogenase [Polynucleobacter sp. 24-46-87]|jgi:lactate dehydrogenase-like 2-hydroxyacid dehydrogenase|uniref:2-hydroxyacid dehydrogenase n=1 Tax=unclassified Polynucleobacter TaxID=2640945 RepID=UPI000BD28CBC|nr:MULTISPECIES: 2-hydroxyacid dehydrogenase [unclassified Polynucleobacter]OYY20826.1 MAG: hydroxyacid dehydrogenase [Polynucleobacter sp. 35-46-11]OZA15578.1 MAG: hydroxyacid dehydrogenase [Polynucleobacter sp. 24-46-87]OZA76248.1 MAG: hydroxyacid dehydrogenase [Polynucleobacter sp. 39-46-10]